jgi:hypothetical protein
MTRRVAFSLALIGAAAGIGGGAARGQLVIGTADRTESAYVVNLGTTRPTNQCPVTVNIADATSVSFGASVWGVSANDAARQLYFIDVAPLSVRCGPDHEPVPAASNSTSTAWRRGTERLIS